MILAAGCRSWTGTVDGPWGVSVRYDCRADDAEEARLIISERAHRPPVDVRGLPGPAVCSRRWEVVTSRWTPAVVGTEDDAYPGLGLLFAGVDRRERAALEQAQRPWVVRYGAADRAVPCLVPGPNLWLSDDAMERQVAVRRCESCPVITECGAIATAVPSQAWGVFGGRDYSHRDRAG